MMTPVDSSNIKAIGQEGPHLRVQFHSGDIWEYTHAGRHHDAMLGADSVGKYFHANIKGKHEGRKVDG